MTPSPRGGRASRAASGGQGWAQPEPHARIRAWGQPKAGSLGARSGLSKAAPEAAGTERGREEGEGGARYLSRGCCPDCWAASSRPSTAQVPAPLMAGGDTPGRPSCAAHADCAPGSHPALTGDTRARPRGSPGMRGWRGPGAFKGDYGAA